MAAEKFGSLIMTTPGISSRLLGGFPEQAARDSAAVSAARDVSM
jgi:hypothetical protein